MVLPCCTATAQADLRALAATRERPLFSPTRRRPPTAPVTVAPVVAPLVVALPPPPPAFQLSGVVVGDKTVAIVKRAADAKVLSLEVGREVDGWTVAAIRPREVDIRQGGRSVTLRLSPR